MSKNTQIISWADELAKQAEVAIANEPTTMGCKFFSLKGGILTWDGEPIVNNEMPVIILDSMYENVYYEGHYQADSAVPPTCYALSRTGVAMTPHEDILEKGTQICESCAQCEYNKYGSATNKKGKKCKNSRRLAMVSAGNFNRNGEFEFNSDLLNDPIIGILKIPVTSTKNYSDYVRKTAMTFKRPPFGVITNIKVVLDPKTLFKIQFTTIGAVADEHIQSVMDCVKLAEKNIEFPYNLEPISETPETTYKRKY